LLGLLCQLFGLRSGADSCYLFCFLSGLVCVGASFALLVLVVVALHPGRISSLGAQVAFKAVCPIIRPPNLTIRLYIPPIPHVTGIASIRYQLFPKNRIALTRFTRNSPRLPKKTVTVRPMRPHIHLPLQPALRVRSPVKPLIFHGTFIDQILS